MQHFRKSWNWNIYFIVLKIKPSNNHYKCSVLLPTSSSINTIFENCVLSYLQIAIFQNEQQKLQLVAVRKAISQVTFKWLKWLNVKYLYLSQFSLLMVRREAGGEGEDYFHISIMDLIDTLHTSVSDQPRFYAKCENLIIHDQYTMCVIMLVVCILLHTFKLC